MTESTTLPFVAFPLQVVVTGIGDNSMGVKGMLLPAMTMEASVVSCE